jgi:BR serine/threonine kinase
VKLGEPTTDKKLVAIKVKNLFLIQSWILNIKSEKKNSLFRFLDHLYLIKIPEVCESTRHIYIILEYVKNWELFEFIASRGCLGTKKAVKFLRRIT